jgi:hypothetical protein
LSHVPIAFLKPFLPHAPYIILRKYTSIIDA